MHTITKEQIKVFKISFHDFNEQQFIVNKLDTLSAETEKLEIIYQQKLLNLEELKKV